MPILRAGPWGNLSDSFQNTGSTGAYPVNIAKGNWPTQNWAAYYEAEVAEGCCTPETVSITNVYLSSMTRDDGICYRYSYYEPGVVLQELWYRTAYGHWELYCVADGFYVSAYLVSNDPCDPTGTYTDYYGGPDPVVSTP